MKKTKMNYHRKTGRCHRCGKAHNEQKACNPQFEEFADVPRITATSVSTEHAQPELYAWFDDGTQKRLFGYCPEHFQGVTPAHFVGLTEAEAHAFKHAKDAAYIRGGAA